MKNLKRLLLFYSVLLSISVLLYSCCNQTANIVGAGEMFLQDSSRMETDTINTAFHIILNPYVIYASNKSNMSLITSSHAFSCDHTFLNMLDLETIKISCDKDFQYGNETIKSGTNFYKIEGIGASSNTYESAELNIEMDSVFIQNAIFENERYTFQLEIKTDNDLTIKNTASAYMDL